VGCVIINQCIQRKLGIKASSQIGLVYRIYPTKFATQTSFALQTMPAISEATLLLVRRAGNFFGRFTPRRRKF